MLIILCLIFTLFSEVAPSKRLLIEDDLATQMQKMMLRMSKLEDCMKQRGVGFTASMSDHRRNLTLHEVLRFDHLVTNQGNSFYPQTGIFTAPYPGLYVFDITIGITGTTDVEILKNGVHLVRVYGHGDSNWETATGSVTTHLNEEDHVYVRNLYYNHGLVGHELTTFSGFIVQPDCAE